MRFSWSIHLLMCFSLETLTSMIRTGKPILVKLKDLMNSFIISLSQTTLLRWLTFLLGSLIVTLKVLLLWIYLFLLTLVIVLQWLPLRWEIPIMLLSQFPWTFHQTQHRDTPFHCIIYGCFSADGDSLHEMFHGKIFLNSVLLLIVLWMASGWN